MPSTDITEHAICDRRLPGTIESIKGFLVSLSPVTLRYWLIKARDLLAMVAPVTPLKSDDAIVHVMTALIEDAELFGFFEKAVDDEDSGKLSLVGIPPVALQAALQARNIDWQKLLTYLPTIIEIIRSLRG